jgi:hypothetical protein
VAYLTTGEAEDFRRVAARLMGRRVRRMPERVVL